MQRILILFFFSTTIYAGIITHDTDEGGHAKATSHQNIHIVHYHPVPTFIKKEYLHLLKHPISIGESSSSLEVHHGDKHDYGYAIGDSQSTRNEGSDHGDDDQQEINDSYNDNGSFGHGDYGSQGGSDGDEELGDNGNFGGYDGHYQQDSENEGDGAENETHKDY